MTDLYRRGFLQLVGLGAVGSLASVPLFGVGKAVAAPVSFLAGHLVVSGGFVEGTARLILGTPEQTSSVVLCSSNARRTRGDAVALSENVRTHQLLGPGADSQIVKRVSFDAGRVRLKTDVISAQHRSFERPLQKGEDGMFALYLEVRRMRDQIHDEANQLLMRMGHDNHPKNSFGMQIVTVVHEPLSGTWAGRQVVIDASFDHWIVQGRIDAEEIYSGTGEYPVGPHLDVERLVWIDGKVRSGDLLLK